MLGAMNTCFEFGPQAIHQVDFDQARGQATALGSGVASGHKMPDWATQAFTDPDAYYASIRDVVGGIVTEHGDYRAEFTRVDFSRLWMGRG